MIRRPPRSTQSRSSAASDVYKRQVRMTNQGACVARTPVPTVSFVSVNGAGSGAAGTAVVNNSRRVTGVTLTSAGSGYTMPPRVVFGGTNCTGETATTTLNPTGVLAVT